MPTRLVASGPVLLVGGQTARQHAGKRSFPVVRAKPELSSASAVSRGATHLCVYEASVAFPDSDTWPWMNLCIPELSGLGRVVSRCDFPLATTARRNVHTDRSGWVACAVVGLLGRSHGLTIAAPFSRRCPPEGQCPLLPALGHAVQASH